MLYTSEQKYAAEKMNKKGESVGIIHRVEMVLAQALADVITDYAYMTEFCLMPH